MEEKSKVYIQADREGRLTGIEGGYTVGNITDFRGWILFDEGYGDRYNLCQSNYLPKPLKDERGICRYALEAGSIRERTKEEMDGDYVPPDPSTEEDLMAMMVDHEFRLTLLELGLADF